MCKTGEKLCELGWRYQYGTGVEKDKDRAFENYKKAADLENGEGLFWTGFCYNWGIGVEINEQNAFECYLKSAKTDNLMGIWKTAICYLYGIGVTDDDNKYHEWIRKDAYIDYSYIIKSKTGIIHPKAGRSRPHPRDPKYGKCLQCNNDNTREMWCQACDPDITIQEWTSGNKDIDNCLNEFRIRTTLYECMIEWIPFNRFDKLELIGEGGFGFVYSAIWLDGTRKINQYKRTRETSSIVALKTLPGSKENILDFLKEFNTHKKCTMFGSNLNVYGLTQNIETKEYFMVLQYANDGNLYKFLKKNFNDLTWKIKLKLLLDIAIDLKQIHFSGNIHRDFHSGNILQDKGDNDILHSYISDLGLSKKVNENDTEGNIYGIMPYVAPEVLQGQKFTKASDIYGFGVVMTEMSTGQRPFDGHDFDVDLAIKICNGLRPEFAPGTPDFYINLALRCMDPDPRKRPWSYYLWRHFNEWNKVMEDLDDENEIKKQFLDSDKITKGLSIGTYKHLDHMYTSKLISTRQISEAIINSELQDLRIPDV